MTIKAAVVGATGYAGAELVRLLACHPNVEITGLSSTSFAGQSIDEIYPSFKKCALPVLADMDTAIAEHDRRSWPQQQRQRLSEDGPAPDDIHGRYEADCIQL